MQFRRLPDYEFVKHSASGGTLSPGGDLDQRKYLPSTFVPPLSGSRSPSGMTSCQGVDNHPMRWTPRSSAPAPNFRLIFLRFLFSITSGTSRSLFTVASRLHRLVSEARKTT